MYTSSQLRFSPEPPKIGRTDHTFGAYSGKYYVSVEAQIEGRTRSTDLYLHSDGLWGRQTRRDDGAPGEKYTGYYPDRAAAKKALEAAISNIGS